MHRVFHEPHANIMVSVLEGTGEVIVHRLSDNAYRVKCVIINTKPSCGYLAGDLVIEGSMDDVEEMFYVKDGGMNKMQEISRLNSHGLILGAALDPKERGTGLETFKLTERGDPSDNNEELRFITEMDDVLEGLNTFMERLDRAVKL